MGARGFNVKGKYGETHRVCISRMINILDIVDFARNMSKAASKNKE
jgi:hypothetical protein